MMTDNLENALSFGADVLPDEPVVQPTPEAPEAPAETGEQPRTADGKFASQTPPELAPEPAPVAPAADAAPATPAKPEAGFVPLAAVLDEREKRQKLQRELEELRSTQRQPQTVPSITEDPEGFQNYVSQMTEAAQRNTVFNVSERFAVKEHGKEAVDAAKEWALSQPTHIRQGFVASEDPIGEIVSHYKREQMLKDIGTDPEPMCVGVPLNWDCLLPRLKPRLPRSRFPNPFPSSRVPRALWPPMPMPVPHRQARRCRITRSTC